MDTTWILQNQNLCRWGSGTYVFNRLFWWLTRFRNCSTLTVSILILLKYCYHIYFTLFICFGLYRPLPIPIHINSYKHAANLINLMSFLLTVPSTKLTWNLPFYSFHHWSWFCHQKSELMSNTSLIKHSFFSLDNYPVSFFCPIIWDKYP